MPDWKGMWSAFNGSQVTIQDGNRTVTGILEMLNEDIGRIVYMPIGGPIEYIYINVAMVLTVQTQTPL